MKTENQTEVSPRIRAITFCALLHGQTVQAWDSSPVIPCKGAEKREVSLEIGKAWKSALEAVTIKNGKKFVTAQVVLAQVNSDAQSLRNQALQWLDSPDGADILPALPDKLRKSLTKDLPSAILSRQSDREKQDVKAALRDLLEKELSDEFNATVEGSALSLAAYSTAREAEKAAERAATAATAYLDARDAFTVSRMQASTTTAKDKAAREAEHLAEIQALKDRLAAFEAAQAPAKTSRKRAA